MEDARRDKDGNIRWMSGQQEVVATVTKGEYSEAEWKGLGGIAAPGPPMLDKPNDRR